MFGFICDVSKMSVKISLQTNQHKRQKLQIADHISGTQYQSNAIKHVLCVYNITLQQLQHFPPFLRSPSSTSIKGPAHVSK